MRRRSRISSQGANLFGFFVNWGAFCSWGTGFIWTEEVGGSVKFQHVSTCNNTSRKVAQSVHIRGL